MPYTPPRKKHTPRSTLKHGAKLIEHSQMSLLAVFDSTQKPPYALLQLVAQLDNYSLLALLQAFPKWYQHAVLITDHEWPHLFWDLNVNRVILDLGYCSETQDQKEEGEDRQLEYYSPTKHTQMIQLIEISSTETMKKLLHSGNKKGLGTFNTLSRSTTFVYLRLPVGPDADIETLVEFQKKLKELSYHFHTSCQPLFTDTSFLSQDKNPLHTGPIYSPDSNLVDRNAFNDLATLRIEGIRIVSNLDLPFLQNLSIVFRTPPNDRSRPTVTKLSIPMINYFVIHYDGVIPTIREINNITTTVEIVDDPADQNTMSQTIRVFELANIGAIEGNKISAHHQRQYTPTPIDQAALDLSFLSRGAFTTISLIGVPHFIIHDNISLFKIQYLHIQSSMLEERQCMDPRSLPMIPEMKAITLWDSIEREGEVKCKFMSQLEEWVIDHTPHQES